MPKGNAGKDRVPYTVRLDQDTYELLMALAKMQDMTASELSRTLIEEGVKRMVDPVTLKELLEQQQERLMALASGLEAARNEPDPGP
ncbi:hypothetical protein [Rhodococcus ruber]|uniref:hypothetical protein n=1 Tax=Rhodococcus ruber TaxID=1830 RepID=UPI00065FD4B5|nr:hypothetical protein [Rhodococcus ruber]MCF8786755.1 hypothetical protein [Rhodococcus ruber]WKK14956.1 hypothetical protein QYN14_27600 [Rhodococcus ruber]